MRTERRDIQPALAHLECALEASCATLMALQGGVIGLPAAPEVSAVQAQLERAIALVREAIAEMRALHDVETVTPAFGFVLGADPARSVTQYHRHRSPGGHLSPRRTA
jgi:hypothetical protein